MNWDWPAPGIGEAGREDADRRANLCAGVIRQACTEAVDAAAPKLLQNRKNPKQKKPASKAKFNRTPVVFERAVGGSVETGERE